MPGKGLIGHIDDIDHPTIDFGTSLAYACTAGEGAPIMMRLTAKRSFCDRLWHVWLLSGMLLTGLPLSARTVLIYVTNYAGDSVDVIDPLTNKVVQVIEGVEGPHGIDFSPDGSRVYISSEAQNVLYVVDRKSGKITNKVALSGRPNNIAITKDGGRVLVCVREEPGALDVIDTNSLERVKSIPMNGPLHNVYVTPDGRFAVMGSEETKLLTVVDLRTEQPVWNITFDNGVRNMAFETAPDGSTRRIFVLTSYLHGFQVVDFAERKVVAKIKLPDQPNGGKNPDRAAPSHGLGVTPDGKTLWVNGRNADAVFVYSLPDLKLMGHVLTGVKPDWITISPDGKMLYDSNVSENTVSAIDTTTLKEVARIPVGQGPKRSNALVLP